MSNRFASRVLSRAECSVSGAPAYRVDFEVANVDQLQLTPDARWLRSRIVMIRTPFVHVPSRRRPKESLPIVLVAGLRAAPEDFERLASDFDLMLDRIVIANARGALALATPVAQTCRVPASEPSPDAASAAPDAAAPSASPEPAASAPDPAAPAGSPAPAGAAPAPSSEAAPAPAPPVAPAPVTPVAPGGGTAKP